MAESQPFAEKRDLDRVFTDPDGVRRDRETELLEEKGREGLDENERYLDAAWEQVI